VYIFSPQDMGRIDRVLSGLRAQTTAESALLIEETGYVISAKGMLTEADLPSLAALVVASRATTSQLASLLGESESFALHYLEGQRVAVYTAGVGGGLFLVVVVPRTVKQGVVWVYTKKAASEIEKMAAAQVADGAPAAAGKPPLDSTALRAEMATQQLDNLFTEQTVSAGADLADSVQTLTFEEALARGLLGNMNLGE
jgi:predicted regulator of Ras-like GTPase activity (Roadblock/LC7/MglB family)